MASSGVIFSFFVHLNYASGMGLLDWIPFNLGEQKVQQPTITDYASQGISLLNYISSIRPDSISKVKETNLLGIPGVKGAPDLPGLPNVPLLKGVPVVPGISGSFPGVGACLPKGTPLINPASPSIFQDLLRGIPGAQDLLKSLNKPAKVDPSKLMGKWSWVSLKWFFFNGTQPCFLFRLFRHLQRTTDTVLHPNVSHTHSYSKQFICISPTNFCHIINAISLNYHLYYHMSTCHSIKLTRLIFLDFPFLFKDTYV